MRSFQLIRFDPVGRVEIKLDRVAVSVEMSFQLIQFDPVGRERKAREMETSP